MYKKFIPFLFLLLTFWADKTEAQRVKTNTASKSWSEAIADAKFKAHEQLKKQCNLPQLSL
ncbi:MAG: hypothetical protein LIO65_06975 [Odoribacter sp.]|nr:hypothetical protein [Odoribacter sp.]